MSKWFITSLGLSFVFAGLASATVSSCGMGTFQVYGAYASAGCDATTSSVQTNILPSYASSAPTFSTSYFSSSTFNFGSSIASSYASSFGTGSFPSFFSNSNNLGTFSSYYGGASYSYSGSSNYSYSAPTTFDSSSYYSGGSSFSSYYSSASAFSYGGYTPTLSYGYGSYSSNYPSPVSTDGFATSAWTGLGSATVPAGNVLSSDIMPVASSSTPSAPSTFVSAPVFASAPLFTSQINVLDTPEPMTMFLAGSGLIGLALVRRKSRKK